MRIGLGILTLAAGVAALSLWFVPSTVESELSVVSDIGTGGVASLSAERGNSGSQRPDHTSPETNSTSRFFGSALPVTPARVTAAGTDPKATATTPSAQAPSNAWTTDVVIFSGAREQGFDPVLSAPARVVATSGASATRYLPRQEIARALQAELKRVGCYFGEVDGEWGPGSKRSLRAFIEHANSGISSDEPDLIQLTLVRGYHGTACRAAPARTNGTTTATRTQSPVVGPAIAPARAPFTPSAPTFATSPAPAPAPVVTGTIDTPASGSMRPASFEGRMTVGAPLPADAALSEAAPLTAAPGSPTSQPRALRPRPQQQPQHQAQRRDRAWTGNFFNQ
jgi:hypothetical protein